MKKEHPLQSGCSRKRFIWSLDHASSVGRQERHFYFFLLFLLSRKFRNATTKPPKVQSKVNIPRKIEIISKAVITTLRLRSASVRAKRMSTGHPAPLPMYSGKPVIWLGRLPFYTSFRSAQNWRPPDVMRPVMGTLPTCFHARILYHFIQINSMLYRTLVLVFSHCFSTTPKILLLTLSFVQTHTIISFIFPAS